MSSTNLTIDEVMLKFEDRITQKITFSDKPISTRFKIFTLEDSDYIYNWECIRPELTKGILAEKQSISVNISDSDLSFLLNPTQSVVICLVKCLSIYIQKGLSFHLFLDNLFLYWKSAIALEEHRIAVIETI